MFDQKTMILQLPDFQSHYDLQRARFLRNLLLFLTFIIIFHFIFDQITRQFDLEMSIIFVIEFLLQLVSLLLLYRSRINAAVWIFLISWWGAYVFLSLTLENHLLLGSLSIVITILLIAGIVGTPVQTITFGILTILSNICFTILMIFNELSPKLIGIKFTVSNSNIITILYFLWTILIYFTNQIVQKSFVQINMANEELNTMLANVPMGIWYVDLSGKTLRVNDYIINLFGYSVEELATKSFFDFAHPDDIEKGQIAIEDLTDQNITHYVDEKRCITKSGQIIDVIIHVRPILNSRNKPTHFVTSIEDVTERKKFGAILKSNKNKYNAIYDYSPIMMHVLNASGDLIEVNQAWLDTFGYSREEVIGKQAISFLTEDSQSYALEVCYPQFIETGRLDQVEFLFVAKSGTVINCLISAIWIDEPLGNEPGYGLSFLMNITNLRKTEALLHQTQRLDSLGNLAGGIAHDFNNLLTGALTQVSLLMHQLESDSWAYQRASKTKTSLDRAAELTNQLLTYVGKGTSHFQQIDLNQLLKASQGFLSVGVPLYVQPTHHIVNVPLPIFADRSQVQQIFQNLIANSVEAINPELGGEITISTRLENLDAIALETYHGYPQLQAGNFAVFCIEDSGVGMEQETLDHVFEPFFTTKESGYGLGLASILGIIKQHRGGIQIRSSIEEGTAVTIIIPTLSESQAQDEFELKPALLEPVDLKASILVADDQQETREAIKEALEEVGATVLVTANGQEAEIAFTQSPTHFDIVILDLKMPIQNGIETFAKIKTVAQNQKIILTSGNPDLYKDQLNQLNHPTFLQKPFDSDTLISCVNNLLAK